MLGLPRCARSAGLGRVDPHGHAAVGTDPAPLTAAQLGVVARCAARELRHGLHDVSAEVVRWRECASRIEDVGARDRVLHDLRAKRSYVNGSAYFNNLLPRRSPALPRLLAAFQILANYLDALSERDAERSGQRPRGWSSMLCDAVDLGATPDPGLYRAVGPEGQYLRALVDACRAGCMTLPGYAAARPMLVREAGLVATLDLEHDPCRASRDDGLQTFVRRAIGADHDLAWWELAAGASSALTVTVVLTLAASADATSVAEIRQATEAYRYVASLAALLDNYIDQEHDLRHGSHNYILDHGEPERTTSRIRWLIVRTLTEVQRLPDTTRHTLLVANMIAMFLSSDEARSSARRSSTAALLYASGATTRALVPVLRGWRLLHRQRAG